MMRFETVSFNKTVIHSIDKPKTTTVQKYNQTIANLQLGIDINWNLKPTTVLMKFPKCSCQLCVSPPLKYYPFATFHLILFHFLPHHPSLTFILCLSSHFTRSSRISHFPSLPFLQRFPFCDTSSASDGLWLLFID